MEDEAAGTQGEPGPADSGVIWRVGKSFQAVDDMITIVMQHLAKPNIVEKLGMAPTKNVIYRS